MSEESHCKFRGLLDRHRRERIKSRVIEKRPSMVGVVDTETEEFLRRSRTNTRITREVNSVGRIIIRDIETSGSSLRKVKFFGGDKGVSRK